MSMTSEDYTGHDDFGMTWVDCDTVEIKPRWFRAVDVGKLYKAESSDLHSWDIHELAVRINALINSRPSSPTVEELKAVISGRE